MGQQVKDKVSARIGELAETIEQSGPTLEALGQSSQVTSAERAVAQGTMIECANAFRDAQSEHGDSEASLKSAQKEVQETTKLWRANKRSLDEAIAELDLFRDGALAAFHALRDRSPPVVESIVVEQTVKPVGLESAS